MRVVQQALREGVLLGGLIIAEDAREKADDGIGDHQRMEDATGEDIISDRDLIINKVVAYTLIDALVVSTEKNEIAFACEIAGCSI